MRLWHKDLIPYLPRQQLLSQYRECCCIAKNISENGTPNHILVNKVMEYHFCHFLTYAQLVAEEMRKRGYKVDFDKFNKWTKGYHPDIYKHVSYNKLFHNWHNERYLIQCLMNLQEKYDCGGISEKEWIRVSSIIKEVEK